MSDETLVTLRDQASQDFAAFTPVAATETLLISAGSLAFKHRLRAGDALHLASAVSMLGNQFLTVTMVSADLALPAAAALEGLKTINPTVRP